MKYFLIIIFFLLSINTQASMKSMYVAGGCFWCVEEVYEKIEGVLSVYSGYSGGHVENPTYQEVVLGNTGHICLLYTSPSPRDLSTSRMPSSA